jgi:integrase
MRLKFVHAFRDRHGQLRFYFRRAGFKQVPLPNPGTPEFLSVYQEALAGQPNPIGASRIKPGTMRALAASYYGSISFTSMKATSQRVRRLIIDRFCQETDRDGGLLGDKPAAGLRREHVVKLMVARSAKPDSANGLRKALRALMQHAVEIGMRADDPTQNVKAVVRRSEGFHSWTDDEIAQFEARHPIGSRARLALALLLYTGQRRSDVIVMGRQHRRNDVLRIRQLKTGAELHIPMHPDLVRMIESTPEAAGDMTFLRTEFGRPFTAAGFGNWFRDRCNEAGLRQCTAHGLRKAAARRLAEAGCTAHEIAAITGHLSLREVSRYTRAVDQERLAGAAMEKQRANINWQTCREVCQKGEKR